MCLINNAHAAGWWRRRGANSSTKRWVDNIQGQPGARPSGFCQRGWCRAAGRAVAAFPRGTLVVSGPGSEALGRPPSMDARGGLRSVPASRIFPQGLAVSRPIISVKPAGPAPVEWHRYVSSCFSGFAGQGKKSASESGARHHRSGFFSGAARHRLIETGAALARAPISRLPEHTDADGEDGFNQALSRKKRAQGRSWISWVKAGFAR